ncbi:MAG: DUF881 domain-containing protein [Chloroflexi bacterium]|nr:DUF881 domain-containing protein [Chloroflexota bacterium]
MRSRSSIISLTLVCFLLGLMLAMQFHAQGKIARSAGIVTASDQAIIISNLYDSNMALRREVSDLTSQLERYERSIERSDLTIMAEELNQLRLINGLSEVSGLVTAIFISGELRAEELQDLINELRNAGAEAIAINEQRIGVRTAVVKDKIGLRVNDVSITPPYVFKAIGRPETLERALTRKGGLVGLIQAANPEMKIAVTKRTYLVLPLYRPGYEWRFARPAGRQ